MTIDEFEAKFNEYYNKLMNADSILSENQTKLDSLKSELEKQNKPLNQVQKKMFKLQLNR